MAIRFRAEDLVRLGRFILVVEGVLLVVAAVLGAFHAVLTRGNLLDSFLLMSFVLFVLLLFLAVLSGPGTFLSRPKMAPLGPEGTARWRQWLSAPRLGGEEFSDLLLYTGLGFLLLVIATGIGALAEALGA